MSSGSRMQLGWPGLLKAITLTMALTSAFWIVLGGWWFHGHVDEAHRGAPPLASAGATPASADKAAPPARGASVAAMMSPVGIDVAPAPAGPLIIPVAGITASRLIDTFAEARAAGARRHDAIDITAPLGTPVIAAAAGTVEKLFLSKDGGNTVYVRLDDGQTIHFYAHLDSYAAGLIEGRRLARGAPVGTVGFSGNASPDAPHLHFAILATAPGGKWHETSTALNPYPLLVAGPDR